MNFKKLNQKERRLVLETMWQVSNVVFQEKISLKEAQAYSYDSTASEIFFSDVLEHVENCKEKSKKYLQLRKILSEEF